MNLKTMTAATAAFLAAGAAWAATGDTATAASAAPATGMTIGQIIEYGGWLMYPLAGLSVVGLALIIYFVATLREDQVVPKKFVSGVRDLLVAGKLAEAQAACRSNASPVSAILLVALDYALRTDKPDAPLIRELMEGEGARQATLIQNQTQYLVDVAAIAPMIGLLGTVTGMLQAFNTVALDLAKAKPMLLAAGVSQALITTVAGLVIAIPAAMAYAYFRGRSAKLISSMESVCAEFATLICEKSKS